jgi:hypothetical protein
LSTEVIVSVVSAAIALGALAHSLLSTRHEQRNRATEIEVSKRRIEEEIEELRERGRARVAIEYLGGNYSGVDFRLSVGPQRKMSDQGFSLTNIGRAAAERVRVVLENPAGKDMPEDLGNEKTEEVGTLLPGEKRRIVFYIVDPAVVLTRPAWLIVSWEDLEGPHEKRVDFKLEVAGYT